MTEEVFIRTEYIKLDQLLKFSGMAAIGSEAKEFIKNGQVYVNDVVCNERGKKIRVNDKVRVNGKELEIRFES